MRNPQDFFAGAVYTAFGLAAILIGRDYEMGTATRMGPAYFPSVLGGLLLLIGLIAIVRSFWVSGEPLGKFAFKPLFIVTIAVVIFGAIVRYAGLIPAVAILVVIGALASRRFRWWPTLALALGLVVFSAAVFVAGLGVPLPLIGTWLR